MPRAGDLLPLDLPLRKGSPSVGTGVIEGVETPLQSKEGDFLAIDLDQLPLPGSEVTSGGNFNKPCRSSPPVGLWVMTHAFGGGRENHNCQKRGQEGVSVLALKNHTVRAPGP